jgi:hypothetical protein
MKSILHYFNLWCVMKFEIYHATYYKILFILKHMLCNLIEF